MIVKGQKVNNRYEILKPIGEGGMANVYLARDIILDRNVAIKVLRGDLSTDEKFVRRFQREALSASSLSHPNIVEIYDVGEDNGDYYIVMEYIPGKNLKQLLKKRQSLTPHEVIDIMLQITSAMSVAHDSLIIHRDLKPQNILIMDDGGIKITDFGIAMALNATQLTQTNSAMGSVHYFPPEQASGKGATLKSDVYSLGIMTYELLTGFLPFRGDNAVEIALKHLKEPFPSIRSELPNLPQSIENVIIKATAKNPKNRYNNANEMHEDLLTVFNKERLEEPKIEFKFNEGINEEDAIYIDKNSDIDDSIIKEIKNNDEEKGKKIIILVLILSFLALVLIGIFVIYPKLTKVPDIEIPSVNNFTQEVAEAKLKNLKFEINPNVLEEPSDDVDEGNVINTSPAAGRTVKEGTEITLIISTGEESMKIEDYTNKNYIAVQTTLQNFGIIVEIEEKETDKEIKDADIQKIIGQDIKPNERLKKGYKITLYIPKQEERYPDIVKEAWSVTETEEWAKKKEINLVIEYIETEEYEEGTIISQSRNTDSIIVKNATLKIKVAKKNTKDQEEDTEESTENHTGSQN